MPDDVDLLAALFDWTPTESCTRMAHAAGADGCVPSQTGTHLVRMMHGVSQNECTPLTVVACLGHCDWIRRNRDRAMRCPTCHDEGPLRRFIQLAGPITGSDWTGSATGSTL